jgi:hypothetical protein
MSDEGFGGPSREDHLRRSSSSVRYRRQTDASVFMAQLPSLQERVAPATRSSGLLGECPRAVVFVDRQNFVLPERLVSTTRRSGRSHAAQLN